MLQPVSARLSAPQRFCFAAWVNPKYWPYAPQSDGVRERPSEQEAEAALAAGGDLDVGDGHCCHPPPSSQPPAACQQPAEDQPPADGRVPTGAAPADRPAVQHNHALSQRRLASDPQTSTASRLRADSAVSEDDSSGAVPSTNAPMQRHAGRLVRGRITRIIWTTNESMHYKQVPMGQSAACLAAVSLCKL